MGTDPADEHREERLKELAIFGKKKKKSKPRRSARVRKLADPAKAARRQKMTQVVLGLIVGALGVLGLVVGLNFLRDEAIHQNALPIKRVVLENQPDWMDDATATGLCRIVSDLAAEDPSDLKLPAKAAARLSQSLWVERIAPAGIINDYKGTLSIRCEFRKPIAAVSTGGILVRVDEGAMVLPGTLLPSGVPVGIYKTILGVDSKPPEAGRVWDSPDLLAAVEILRLVDQHPFSREIAAIDVSNYNARQNPAKPHIVMFTDQRTIINWGRAIGVEGRIEVDSQQKLQNLEGVFIAHGSLNKLLYVDLRGREPRGQTREGQEIETR